MAAAAASVGKEGDDKHGDGRWMMMVSLYQYVRIRILRNLFQHQRFLSEARDGEPEVIWIGDSLIQNLFNSRIWDQSFCLMHSVNFGISGDRTENVLWRLENGELEEVAPKVKD